MSINGSGLDAYNVGSYGSSLALPANTSKSVLSLLQAADLVAISTTTLNANISGINSIFNGINVAGGVT